MVAEVTIEFYKIQGLYIRYFGEMPKQITGFDIIDISKNNWEKLKYQIMDYEDDYIGFYCNDIAIISAKYSDYHM